MTCRTLLVTAILTTLAGGCAYPLNAPADLVGAELPALLAPAPGLAHDESPSVTSLDRSDWELVRVVVPSRQVEHPPTFVSPKTWGYPPEYPTAVDALYVEANPASDTGQLVWQPIRTTVAIVLIPITMFTSSATWRAVRGPESDDQRITPDRPEPLWSWVKASATPEQEPPPPPSPGPPPVPGPTSEGDDG